ncbi:MAG: hypothetical protein Q8K33_24165 [Cypionkella sp.]|uniref:phage head-tail joining protein n=1 Tax=Cypionkella sp. TaxID=2811411 RepID=UPI00272EECC6|nr:hypothetical protein [Cypionkella sp.]MDP1620403.1 hypothetical protein [bacterium]MDP2051919.1 hypothetical protein [Cypionkella sp.]
MAFTQTDADNLRAAIARGAKRVRINGEEVEYASMAELRAALAMVDAELAGASRSGFAVIYPRTGRGL